MRVGFPHEFNPFTLSVLLASDCIEGYFRVSAP